MRSKKKVGIILSFAAVFLLPALAGCGGGGGSSVVHTSTIPVELDLSRIAGAAVFANTDVSAQISVLTYDTVGNPVMEKSTLVTLAYDVPSQKHKGTATISGITPGSNIVCRVTTYSPAARTASQTGTAFAYLGAIMGTLTDGNMSTVNVNATSTVAAQAGIFYAIANAKTPSDTSFLTDSFKATLSATVATLVGNSTINPDDYILKSSTGSDPFESPNWSFPYTKKLELVVNSMGMGDLIPPRVVDYSPRNGDTNVQVNGPSLEIVFSETMDSTIDLNDQATLTASGYKFIMERRDNGHQSTLDSTTALNYGTFSWATTNYTDDTLVFTLFSSSTLGAKGLAWLGPGLTYDVISRTISSYLKDAAGKSLDTRAAFPSTNFPPTGYFTTAP